MSGYVARATWCNMQRESLRPDEVAERVLQIIADGEPRSPRDIHRPNGLLPTPTSSALLELVRAGTVIREGHPGHFRYRLAPCDSDRMSLAPAMVPETQQEPA